MLVSLGHNPTYSLYEISFDRAPDPYQISRQAWQCRDVGVK